MSTQKKRRRRRAAKRRDNLAGYKIRPLGTKAQAKRNQESRDLKNQIFELKTALNGANVVIENLSNLKHEHLRQIDAMKPTRVQQMALDAIVRLPVEETERLGITDHVVAVARWNREMRPRVLATGKNPVEIPVTLKEASDAHDREAARRASHR